jgi:Protein of unknown function (DUF3570)
MQLTSARPASPIRARLAAAACLLVASGAPTVARAEDTSTTHLDAAALVYGEKGRTQIVEPMAKLTHLFNSGQSLSAQFSVDVMTGASPSGAMPAGRVQTVTSASGSTTTNAADAIPTKPFSDLRGALDLEWVRPLGSLFTATTGGHFSRERDYQSVGGNFRGSLDVMRRLTTLTFGGGFNRDEVFPIGGTPVPLSDGTTLATTDANDKRVTTALVGISRVLTRRWVMGLHATLTEERGYLTEPYKLVSLIDPEDGIVQSSITEKRPSSRERRSLQLNSTYHLPGEDIAYTSYRYYRDDWGVRSHTVDLKLRHDLNEHDWVQPHVRLYTQSSADFFHFGLAQEARIPAFVTSDERLGPLHTVTLGGTYGFRVPRYAGELSIRAEFIRQWGDGHPASAIGAQRQFDLFPPVATGSLVVSYSVDL